MDSPKPSPTRRTFVRAAIATAGAATLAEILAACTTSKPAPSPNASLNPGPTPGLSNQNVDAKGFSTKVQSLFHSRGGMRKWKSYDDRSPMTNGDGYYLQSNVSTNSSGNMVLSGAIAEATAKVPDGVKAFKRFAGAVAYYDDPQVYGRWTVKARFPKWSEKAFHAVVMIWPNDDNWAHGEVDALETTTNSTNADTFIHDDHPENAQQGQSVALDDSLHTITIEWSRDRGIECFFDNGKTPTIAHPAAGLAAVPHRLTFQLDAEGVDQSLENGPAIKAKPAMIIEDVTYSAYIGLEKSVPTPTPTL